MAEKKKLNDKANKKVKEEKYISDEAKEIRTFVFILIGIIVVVLIVYGVSKLLIKEEDDSKTDEITTGEIDYDIVSIGTMLNRNISEYYVIIYDIDDTQAVLYSSLINSYSSSEGAKKIYFCDLGNKLNANYYVGEDGTSNPSAKTISELKLGNLTLIKVKNGKIVKYIEELDTIKTELGL